jgi:lysozyme family protein
MAEPKKGAPRGGAAAAVALMIAATIAIEGGYVNDPADPGGETNMGITKVVAVQNGYRGPMRTLPREVAQSIYYHEYIVAPGYEPLVTIDAPVTSELYDTTANMGAARPSRWFQQSIVSLCGVSMAIDGHVGPGTIAAYSSCQRRVGATPLCLAMLDSLDAKQRAEYLRLIRVNPKLKRFQRGWLNNRIGNVDRRACSSAA